MQSSSRRIDQGYVFNRLPSPRFERVLITRKRSSERKVQIQLRYLERPLFFPRGRLLIGLCFQAIFRTELLGSSPLPDGDELAPMLLHGCDLRCQG